MLSNQNNGKKQGKEPCIPSAVIPQELLNSLKSFRNNNTLVTAKKNLNNMVVFTLMSNQLDGKLYAEMAQLSFEIIDLLEKIYENIPDEFSESDLKEVA